MPKRKEFDKEKQFNDIGYVVNKMNAILQAQVDNEIANCEVKVKDVDLTKLTKLGEGNFGSVYQYEDEEGKKFVLKALNLDELLAEMDIKKLDPKEI